MTKKEIKTSDGIKLWTLDEVIENYESMVCKFARTMEKDLSKYHGNVDAYDDYYQKSIIILMQLYNEYDVKKNVSFSTILYRNLNQALMQEARKLKALKRKIEKPLIYFQQELENGVDLTGAINDGNSSSMPNEQFELEYFLRKNLSEQEIIFLSQGIKTKTESFSQEEVFINLFSDIEKKYGISADSKKYEVADRLGMSRPTLNKHIDLTLEKTKLLLTKYYELDGITTVIA